MIETTINGEQRQVPENLTLRELLQHLKLGEERVAIERNRKIVSREEWERVRVAAGDQLEIVTFVGGG